MELINANWEKRNLDLEAAEISFSPSDTFAAFDPQVLRTFDFVTARVPTGSIQLIHDLENIGFQFIESQFDLSLNLGREADLISNTKAMLDKISLLPIRDNDSLGALCRSISEDMFEVDRVSIDPFIGVSKGAIRYRNWVRDEFSKPQTSLYEMALGNTPFGFFLLKEAGPKQLSALLAGLYPQFKNKGLGFSIVAKPIEWARQHGYKVLRAKTSSNNLPSLKIHLACGYEIEDIQYIFRWRKTTHEN